MPQRQGDYEVQLQVHKQASNLFFVMMKRVIDVVISCIACVVISPLLLFLWILIKIEEPGAPGIYRQIRIGKDGKPFEMYKFRSMVRDAEARQQDLLHKNEIQGAMFKMKNDPRVTPIGRIIRRTSLDELPQLFNVIRGEMSLVGPRPPLPREVNEYTSYDLQRLTVIPGCTGLWQVSGRNQLGFKEMVELDLQYIRKQSILFDLLILLKTVRVLVGTKDAF
ncbi:sugar transferase [Paenibacillus guangzhouensis]|uniref:sugar transferase n=1 Tax=Paenibacillus guangzhouensis TaxID=1473112 RepID=UPI001D100823|nr:sugar transferase [Paenibacillus guangzhouensis]